MKVLVLDIDGVLHTPKTYRMGHPSYDSVNTIFHPPCLQNLKEVIEACSPLNIVISSTWRETFSIDDFNLMFRNNGLPEIVIGLTSVGVPDSLYEPASEDESAPRGLEIQLYLFKHPEITKYAIVDDICVDIYPYHKRELIVETWESVGLMEVDRDKLIEILR